MEGGRGGKVSGEEGRGPDRVGCWGYPVFYLSLLHCIAIHIVQYEYLAK